jgi:XTP/dITP diphosphohydrolase
LLAPLAVRLSPQSSFMMQTPAETGLSFVENAILKARFAAQCSDLPAIADDSGLEVDALHGAPGIYSARYAGEGASDADNLQKLIDALREVPDEYRTARYRCALVLMRWHTDPAPIVCQASWEGRILAQPRGLGGFGYDPVFELHERKVTAAELAPAEKNRLSHRGQALRQLIAELERGVHLQTRGVLPRRSERDHTL